MTTCHLPSVPLKAVKGLRGVGRAGELASGSGSEEIVTLG